jgi:choloylglycine hydrolase
MIKKIILGMFIILCLMMENVSFACTDFQVKAKDGSIIIGRSMEFAIPMDSEVVVFPRTEKMVSMTPDRKTGISWVPKYGYLGINALGEKLAFLDGLNEAGLSIEFLWFTESKYQEAKSGEWLSIGDLSHWLLGNFATVDEVKKTLPRVAVVGFYAPQLGMVPGFHVAVHDAQGNNIVVEFIDGETRIYDNPIGVMTNKPTFDWQLTNLRNYVHLDTYDKEGKTIGEAKVNAAGSGTGWLGMPGDWSPPSRFVRTVMMVDAAGPAKDAAGAVNLAEHILNAVDIPLGVVKIRNPENKNVTDYTQWIVIKDLTNRILYFRSYQDLTLKKVEMKKLNFDRGAEIKTIRIESGMRTILDMTDKLKGR